MRISKITVFVLIAIIVLSVFVAKISNLISVKFTEDGGQHDEELNKKFDPNLIIRNDFDHLMWFVQISDIHLSIFYDPKRISDLKDFCNTTVDAIKPSVVLASGDLADAKAIDNMGSTQFIQEWEHYKDILDSTKVYDKTLWLDIRGNHDNFNVPSIFNEKSFFHRYSVQGQKHLRSYSYTVQKGKEKYSFIGVDACLDPGPKRPFNFIGTVSEEQFQLLSTFEEKSKGSNGTIWFGHYPTSCIISPNPGIRDLMKNSVAYLCGHLHTLGGTVPNMYTMQQTGVLELELGDWKDNRLFRVAAFDHGLFSFVDVNHGKWPIILITNPKHALFVLPHKEPTHKIITSTHIRILVFSVNSIETVRVKLNDEDWIDCVHVTGPLYVAKWNPLNYNKGLHNIEVYARDSGGSSSEVSQPFSLDGTRLSFRFLPRLALMSNASQVFRGVFMFLVFLSVVPLLGIRIIHYLVSERKFDPPDVTKFYCLKLVRKLWILATIDKLFYPLVFYPLYLTVGPWFIGEVIEGHIGATFAWGTIVQGKLLPGSFTYFYGCVQLFWFHIPFVLVLGHCVDSKFKGICLECDLNSRLAHIWRHFPCAIVLLTQSVFAYFFWLAYGTIALILGPLRTWSVLMGFYLWYSSSKLSHEDFIGAKGIWGRREYVRASTHEL